MAIPLRGWVRPPAMKNGNRLKVLLPLNHFTRALDQLAECRTEESPDTDIGKVERKVLSLSPATYEDFSGHSSSLIAIMFVFCTCGYSLSGVNITIVMWQLANQWCIWNFHFRNKVLVPIFKKLCSFRSRRYLLN